jgi:hypothetical protein
MDRVVFVRLALLIALTLSHTSVLVAQTDERVVPSERVTTFVYVRAEPDAQSDERGRLRKGQSLPFVASVPRWYEVRLPDGTIGFVSKAWTRVTHALAARAEDELRIRHNQSPTTMGGVCELLGVLQATPCFDCPPTIAYPSAAQRRLNSPTGAGLRHRRPRHQLPGGKSYKSFRSFESLRPQFSSVV